ncbi:MAG: histidine phosphatase family protein [bacterium]
MILRNHYYILRHGEPVTSWHKNPKAKYSYPWPDSPAVHLSRKGISDIKKVAESLKGKSIDIVYSSDLYRVMQTAKIVAKAINKPIIFDKRLRDTYLAKYHGHPVTDFYRDFPDPAKRFKLGPKGGESWDIVRNRVKSFIKEVDRQYKDKVILIVSHGDPLMFLIGIIGNLNNRNMLTILSENNHIKKGELRKLN